MEKFHEKLKVLRKNKGLKQQELAEILGIKRNTYSDWENGKCKPNYEKLEKIADFFWCFVRLVIWEIIDES